MNEGKQGQLRLRLARRLGVSTRDLVVLEKEDIPKDAIGRVRSFSLVGFVGSMHCTSLWINVCMSACLGTCSLSLGRSAEKADAQ